MFFPYSSLNLSLFRRFFSSLSNSFLYRLSWFLLLQWSHLHLLSFFFLYILKSASSGSALAPNVTRLSSSVNVLQAAVEKLQTGIAEKASAAGADAMNGTVNALSASLSSLQTTVGTLMEKVDANSKPLTEENSGQCLPGRIGAIRYNLVKKRPEVSYGAVSMRVEGLRLKRDPAVCRVNISKSRITSNGECVHDQGGDQISQAVLSQPFNPTFSPPKPCLSVCLPRSL